MRNATDSHAERSDARRRAADVGIIVLAVLAFATAFTNLGPVLKPFLVAAFLFYVTQFGAKTLARIGLGPRTAYTGLLGLVVILGVLFGQLVYREAAIFLGKWPKYEGRISKAINSLPQLDQLLPDALKAARRETDEPRQAPVTNGTAPAQAATASSGSLGDLFRTFSKSALDYVLRHTLEVAEIFVLVLVYLIFLFIGSQKLPDRIRKAFPGEQGEKLLLISEDISQSMERFVAVKTVVDLGMGIFAASWPASHRSRWYFSTSPASQMRSSCHCSLWQTASCGSISWR